MYVWPVPLQTSISFQRSQSSAVRFTTFMEHLVGVDFTSIRVLDLAVKSSKGVIARHPRDFSSRVMASVRFSAQNMRVRIRILMAQTQQTGARARPVTAHT